MFSELKLTRYQSKPEQVAEFIRGKIRSGAFPAGSQIPSTQRLAVECSLPDVTVHRALSSLVKEGLLTRRPGVGSIVNAPERKLEAVAVYDASGTRAPFMHFANSLCRLVEGELKRRGIDCVLLRESGESFEQLRDMAEGRRVQGVVVPLLSQEVSLVRLRGLPVPFSYFGDGKDSCRGHNDYQELAALAVERLHQRGCRRIGLISSLDASETSNKLGEIRRRRFFSSFHEQLQRRGLETRDDWIIIPARTFPQSDSHHYAYHGFKSIWERQERPDGIFAYTDDLAVGTIMAAMSCRADIPKELRMVIHRNSCQEILCPFPCDFLVTDVEALAVGLVDLVARQFQGEAISSLKMPVRVEEHKGD